MVWSFIVCHTVLHAGGACCSECATQVKLVNLSHEHSVLCALAQRKMRAAAGRRKQEEAVRGGGR